MQKTLFLYIFKDLVKVFLLASGAIAGIMSFAGLLRPLTQHGLDLFQVGEMLGYFMPAMTNYSWPIAVLFATTFVYGRMSADNELIACRAAGLNYFQILTPAVLMGVIVTIASAFLLAFVVPRSFLRAETVVYENLAKLVAGQIKRTQQIRLDAAGQQTTIFARNATVLEPDASRPEDQGVELDDLTIVNYVKGDELPKVPAEFFLARSATAIITMPTGDSDAVRVWIRDLREGQKIPNADAEAGGKSQVNAVISSGQAGPFELQSPVRETSRFMDLYRLLELRRYPEKSRRVQRELGTLARMDQTRAYLADLGARASAGEVLQFDGREGDAADRFAVGPVATGGGQVRATGDRLTISAGTVRDPGVPVRSDLFTGRAHEVLITASPDNDTRSIYATIEIHDAILEFDGQQTPTQSKAFHVTVPMPPKVAALNDRGAFDYVKSAAEYGKDRGRSVTGLVIRQQNQIESELHSRVSFAASCFLLALVGAMIGMMTRSGNFVSAFAVSVGPALLAIVMIVTGQHIAEGMPRVINAPGSAEVLRVETPLKLGLSVLWAGNAIVLGLGVALLARLNRT